MLVASATKLHVFDDVAHLTLCGFRFHQSFYKPTDKEVFEGLKLCATCFPQEKSET